MTIIAKSSGAPGTALFYITVGALMTIWSGVWFFAFGPESRVALGLCAGLFLSGIAFLVIGFGVGRIGHEAKKADLDPEPDPDERGPNTQSIRSQ